MMNLEFPLPLTPADADRVGREPGPAVAPISTDPGARAPAPAGARPTPELSRVLEASAEFFRQHQQHLSFSVDESSGRMVVSVIDSKTSEIIRQIPGEEVLAVSRRLQQMIEEYAADGGLLVEKAT